MEKICMFCKKELKGGDVIEQDPDEFIFEQAKVVSNGLCEPCMNEHYPEYV